jgi:molybdopterin biosynthesis enzyme
LPLPPFTNSAVDGYAVSSQTFREIPHESSLSSAGLRQGPLQSRP